MNITSINSTNPNFGITSKVRIPMKNGTTTLLNVTGYLNSKEIGIFTDITGDIMHNGKIVGKTKEYHNKKGFSDLRFVKICLELSQGAKEPSDIVEKLINSIERPNVDYNA